MSYVPEEQGIFETSFWRVDVPVWVSVFVGGKEEPCVGVDFCRAKGGLSDQSRILVERKMLGLRSASLV